MNFEYHPEASAEIIEATQHYVEEAPSEVALDFDAEVTSAITEILAHPLRFPYWESTSARKYVIPRFPYVIFYLNYPDRIRILAIAHTSRRPGYWKSRIAG